jgi:hypothetical protein
MNKESSGMKIVAAFVLSLAAAGAQPAGDGLTVQVGGKTVGKRPVLNLVPGNGIMHSCTDTGNRVDCTASYNSALIATHDTVHANENYCASTNSTIAYTCDLRPKALEHYSVGMTFLVNVDVSCTTSCSLSINGLPTTSLKRIDGTTDPGGTLIAGEPQWIFYDGKVFRLMGSAGTPDKRGDFIGRRLIGSMDTMTYAPVIFLDVTAGDMHKTITVQTIGNARIDASTGGIGGQHMWILIVNDLSGGKTIAFGANFRSAGAVQGNPGKAATIHFVSDGASWFEVGRTLNL